MAISPSILEPVPVTRAILPSNLNNAFPSSPIVRSGAPRLPAFLCLHSVFLTLPKFPFFVNASAEAQVFRYLLCSAFHYLAQLLYLFQGHAAGRTRNTNGSDYL